LPIKFHDILFLEGNQELIISYFYRAPISSKYLNIILIYRVYSPISCLKKTTQIVKIGKVSNFCGEKSFERSIFLENI